LDCLAGIGVCQQLISKLNKIYGFKHNYFHFQQVMQLVNLLSGKDIFKSIHQQELSKNLHIKTRIMLYRFLRNLLTYNNKKGCP